MKPSPRQDKVRIYTFYSYKGGVGRTMALANVACQMANLYGKRVIAVDWDLEAPGLHHYFGYTDKDLAGRNGLLDYLERFKWQLTQGSKGCVPEVGNYLWDLPDRYREKIRHGSVRTMHCGCTDDNYMARIQAFDWDEFYEKYEGFRVIETLRRQLLDQADIVLVDARAGQADIGTTPTIQFPDALVVLFTSNEQSVEGSARIARNVRNHRLRRELNRPLSVLFVPARVFPKESSFQNWLAETATPVFESLVEEGVIDRRDQPDGLEQINIPVDPQWSIGERLPILDAPTNPDEQRTPEVNKAYVSLARALANLHSGRPAWEIPDSAKAAGEDEITLADIPQLIADAADRGDEKTVADLQMSAAQSLMEFSRYEEAATYLQSARAYFSRTKQEERLAFCLFLLGRTLREQQRFSEACESLEQSLDLNKKTGNTRAVAAILHEMGVIRREEGKPAEAWDLFDRALALKEEAGDAREQGVTLHEMGVIRREEGKFAEAWDLFDRALALKEEAGDARGQGVTLHAMGVIRREEGKFAEARELFRKGLAKATEAVDAEGVRYHQEALKTLDASRPDGEDRDSPGNSGGESH